MTPTTADQEVRDILDRVRKLPPEVQESIAHEVLDELEPAEPMQYASEAVRLAWKAEIARRIAAYLRGEVKTLSVEEVIAQLDAAVAEERQNAGRNRS